MSVVLHNRLVIGWALILYTCLGNLFVGESACWLGLSGLGAGRERKHSGNECRSEVHKIELSEELTITGCNATGSVDLNVVAVVSFRFNYRAGFLPLVPVSTSLVLDKNLVTGDSSLRGLECWLSFSMDLMALSRRALSLRPPQLFHWIEGCMQPNNAV